MSVLLLLFSEAKAASHAQPIPSDHEDWSACCFSNCSAIIFCQTGSVTGTGLYSSLPGRVSTTSSARTNRSIRSSAVILHFKSAPALLPSVGWLEQIVNHLQLLCAWRYRSAAKTSHIADTLSFEGLIAGIMRIGVDTVGVTCACLLLLHLLQTPSSASLGAQDHKS
jgi:hypothetical protein